LVSVGGNDQTVMVWATDFGTGGGASEGNAFAEDEDAAGDQSAPPTAEDLELMGEVDKTDKAKFAKEKKKSEAREAT